MKAIINGVQAETNKIVVSTKSATYTLSESVDGKLTINKTYGEDEETDSISVFPCYANEIKVK
jgi:hypothetical protein